MGDSEHINETFINPLQWNNFMLSKSTWKTLAQKLIETY